MYLCFIDESGTDLPRRAESRARLLSKQPYFVLACVAWSQEEFRVFRQKFMELRQQWFPYFDTGVEFKAQQIWQGEGLFRKIPLESRIALIRELLALLHETHPRSWIIIIDKHILHEDMNTDDMYKLGFWALLSNVAQWLESQHSQALLCLDSRSTLHSAVQDRRLIEAYHFWEREHHEQSKYYLGEPWFGFSLHYPGLQLADIVAYLSARKAKGDLRASQLMDSFVMSYAQEIHPYPR